MGLFGWYVLHAAICFFRNLDFFRFLARFWTLKSYNLYVCMHLNVYASHIYWSIDTKFRIQAHLGGMCIMPQPFFSKF